jgi:O-antigen ligase
VAVIGLAVWVSHGGSFLARARGLSGHYMTFAGQLLLQLPVAIAVAVCERRPRWRIGATLTALLALAALAVTFTRSAWIGLFVECAVIAGAVWPLGLVGLMALAGAAFAFAPGMYRERLYSIFDPNHPWNRQRVFMWDAGLRMLRDHPWTGVGLEDLHALYDRYRSPASTERAGHLHNVFVQIAASMGVIGLAAFGWLYASFYRAAARGLRPQLRRGGIAAGVRLGTLAALTGFLAAGFFEWNFGDEELLYALYILVGIAWAARAWDDANG